MLWMYMITWAFMTAIGAGVDIVTLKYFPTFYTPDTTKYQIFIVGYSVVLAVDYALKKYLPKKGTDETHPPTM